MHTPQHSLVFCAICGSLLDAPTGSEDFVKCHCCHAVVPASAFEALAVTTRSAPSAFPHIPKTTTVDISNSHLRDGATINEKCPNAKCDAVELVFHTAQLRGADEGQTVFYTCVKCGSKTRMNS